MQCVLNTVLICVIQSMSTEFTYCNHVLDGLILDRGGVVLDTKDSGIINVCSPCKSSLARKKIPRFALANGLYRGNLPHEFCDITWVEEKICAIYCTTAHVTRIFQSSDPSQPKVFHGNSYVGGFISVVFVGPGKFKLDQLGTTFQVRKAKLIFILRMESFLACVIMSSRTMN